MTPISDTVEGADAVSAPDAARLDVVLARAMAALEHYVRRVGEPPAPAPDDRGATDSALDRLVEGLGLTPFERDVLVLVVGAELTSEVPQLCGLAHNDLAKPYMTFGLALAALKGGSREATGPEGALRTWGLVEVSGPSPLHSPLRAPEAVTQFLLGAPTLDEKLLARLEPVAPPDTLPASQARLARRLAAAASNGGPTPCLVGAEREVLQIAAAAAGLAQLVLFRLPQALLPRDPVELARLAQLWRRDRVLTGGALAIVLDDAAGADPQMEPLLSRFIDSAGGFLVIVGGASGALVADGRLGLVRLEVPPPDPQEVRQAWADALKGVLEPPQAQALADSFPTPIAAIPACVEAALAQGPGEPQDIAARIAELCKAQGRGRLEGLAQRLDPRAEMQDLVLPAPLLAALGQIAASVRNRHRVLEDWGFRAKSERGLGLSVLFAGASGTGKTMAAEVLAKVLDLDLFRIDLSVVVDKYIGETEKNLRRLFDAADATGAVLLFDEADALFGKRSEVRDSHDRYANIEVGYLLQRIEAYRGVAILTTNLPANLDSAFQRRLAYVLHFPFPDAAARREIWRRAFPEETPTAALSLDALARLNLSGGQIRNVALNAAMLAADEDAHVSMAHVASAAATEREKQGRPAAAAELRGWPE
jgi:hypothetical protein